MVGRDSSSRSTWQPSIRRLSQSISGYRRTERRKLRGRLLFGVPWGTLLVCGVLLGTYLLVQGGAETWTRPLTIPFTSWSYSHPVGVLLGPLAHLGPDHLLGNIAGTLVFGSMAEYLLGHAPPSRAPTDRRGKACVRAGVAFPAGVIGAGILASAFSWGPTIGFSNVVYALAGVVLVRYPVGAVVALVVRDGFEVVVSTVDAPFLVATRTPASDPWFVDVAVQGHVFGLLLGITAGTVLVAVRDTEPPSPARVWTGVALFGLAQSLWAVWWASGTGYVLARGPGLLLVGGLATVAAVGTALTARDRRGTPDRRTRYLGIALLVVPLVVMAAVAVPVNATTNASLPPESEAVEVGEYSITYVEDARNQRLAPLSAAVGTEPPTTSGVVVADPERGIWSREVPASQLASEGTATIRVGGLRWDRTVFVVRQAWQTSGGEVVSQVWLNPDDGGFHRVYASEPARAAPIVAGHNVTLVPTDSPGVGFRVHATRAGERVGTAPLPERNESVAIGPLELRREGDRLLADAGDTRVSIAHRR